MPRRVISKPKKFALKKAKANNDVNVQLFAFDAALAEVIDATNSGGRRSKRQPKAVARFASLQFDKHQPASCKHGYGFSCPSCGSACSYDSRICNNCHLECYYEAGVGVVTLKERAVSSSYNEVPSKKKKEPPRKNKKKEVVSADENVQPVRHTKRGGDNIMRSKSYIAIGGKIKSTAANIASSRRSTKKKRGHQLRAIINPIAKSSTSIRELQQNKITTVENVVTKRNEGLESGGLTERVDDIHSPASVRLQLYESELQSKPSEVDTTLEEYQTQNGAPEDIDDEHTDDGGAKSATSTGDKSLASSDHSRYVITTLEGTLERLRQQNEGLKDQNKSLKDENNSFKDENNSLKTELQISNTKIARLIEQVSRLTKEKDVSIKKGSHETEVAKRAKTPKTAHAKSRAQAQKSSLEALESQVSGCEEPRKRQTTKSKNKTHEDKTPQNKSRKNNSKGDSHELFAFDAAVASLDASEGRWPKRKLKAVVRFDSQRFDKQPVNCKQGQGFACPKCDSICSYDSRRCNECHLECYYEAGVGVLTLKSRQVSGAEKRSQQSPRNELSRDNKNDADSDSKSGNKHSNKVRLLTESKKRTRKAEASESSDIEAKAKRQKMDSKSRRYGKSKQPSPQMKACDGNGLPRNKKKGKMSPRRSKNSTLKYENQESSDTSTITIDGNTSDEFVLDKKLPKELRGLDKRLVETIKNEIVDSGEEVSFDEIAGLESAKEAVRSMLIYPMRRPDLFTGLRGPGKGLLLFGPPGTGKTLIGKAIAHECRATFFSIPSSSLTSKWQGEGEKLVRTLFAVAHQYAPSVVFIDEVDSLLSARKSDEDDAIRRIKAEFLVQLDGAGNQRKGHVLFVGATNLPWELDVAARRRFEERLYIPLPTAQARESLLHILLKKDGHCLTNLQIKHVSHDTDGYSGADLKTLCKKAAKQPLLALGERAMEMDKKDVPPISYDHFCYSLHRVKPSVAQASLAEFEEWNATYGDDGGNDECHQDENLLDVHKNNSKSNSIPPDADTLRGKHALMECDHMRTILPRVARKLKADIADINFFNRLVHSEEDWIQSRRHLYPGPDDNWMSFDKRQYTTAHMHAGKLMVPVHMPGPPEHFLGIVRFQASDGSPHTWDCAIIDSLDNDNYFPEVQFHIENRSTLANCLSKISDAKTDASLSDAKWTRVQCVRQAGVECGCRMILHFYIASYCNSLTEFQDKIDNLTAVKDLPVLVRNWTADWLQQDSVEEQPDWLSNVLGT